MENTHTKNFNDKKSLLATEQEIKKNTDELLTWLGGTVNYFVRSMKALSDMSKDKKAFRSYVTTRMFANIERLSEIADIYATLEDAEQEAEQDINDSLEDDNEEPNFDDMIAKALEGYDIKPDDFSELERFYASSISGILAENRDEFMTMRLNIKAMKFTSKPGSAFGEDLLKYICDHILRARHLPLSTQLGNLLCLVMAVKEIDPHSLGCYAEDISSIIDLSSVLVCMSVTNDFIQSKKKDED